jgi:predicted kinase
MNENEMHIPQQKARDTLALELPRRTLLVLCGAAGCGKSTFARNFVTAYASLGLRTTSIISSDDCRAIICDDENNQLVSRDSFELFHFIIHKRMQQGVFTIADSTALKANARYPLLDLAQRHHYTACLLIFDVPMVQCVERDQQRPRSVGASVIAYHYNLLQQALRDVPHEGWQQIRILHTQSTSVTLEILPDLYDNKESLKNPIVP